jgi:hypothetical protein
MKLGRSNPCVPQIDNPLGIPDIGFASWHRFDMLGISNQEVKSAFQQVEDRFPKHSG